MCEYRHIKGFKRYLVSENGKVYDTIKECHMKQYNNGNNYLMVQIAEDKTGIIRTKKVHKLVIESFKGYMPQGKECVDHINGNRFDNRVENLEYVTISENNRRVIRTKCHHKRKIRMITDFNVYDFSSITDCAKFLKDNNVIRCKINSAIPEIRKCAMKNHPKKTFYTYRFEFI